MMFVEGSYINYYATVKVSQNIQKLSLDIILSLYLNHMIPQVVCSCVVQYKPQQIKSYKTIFSMVALFTGLM